MLSHPLALTSELLLTSDVHWSTDKPFFFCKPKGHTANTTASHNAMHCDYETKRVYLNLMTNKIKSKRLCLLKGCLFSSQKLTCTYIFYGKPWRDKHTSHTFTGQKHSTKLCPNSVYDNCFLLHSAPALISVSFKLICCQNRVVQYLTGKFQRQSF